MNERSRRWAPWRFSQAPWLTGPSNPAVLGSTECCLMNEAKKDMDSTASINVEVIDMDLFCGVVVVSEVQKLNKRCKSSS